MAAVQSYSQMDNRTRAVIVVGTMLALFTSAMDQTTVSTALPRIVASLGGLGLFSWVFTAFMITSTTMVPVVGKLTDLYGRKPFYMAGVAILMLGSALAGSSSSMEQLIGFRALQGLGAGMIMGITFVIIGDVFAPAERARYIGLFTGVFAAASIIGPLIGGALTDHVHWRWVFYVNLPLGGIALTVLGLGMPPIRPVAEARPLDRQGFFLLAAIVVPMLLAFSWGGSKFDWLSPQIVGLLTVVAATTVVFALVEQRAEEPVIAPSLFRDPIFVVSSAVTFLTGVAMFGAISFIPLFVQGVLGVTATNSGLITMPMTIALAVSSTVGGQIISRLGRYRWVSIAGLAVVVGAMFLFAQLDAGSSRGLVTRNMVILGMGLGLAIPVYTLAVQNSVPYRQLGIATSTVQFLRQVGGTMGVAIIGSRVNAVFGQELQANLPPGAKELPPPLLKRVQDPNFFLGGPQMALLRQEFLKLGEDGAQLFQGVMEAARVALATAIADAFLVGFFLAIAALVVGLFLKEIPLRRALLAEPGAPAPAGPAPAGPAPPSLAAAAGDPPLAAADPAPAAPARPGWRLIVLGVVAALALLALAIRRGLSGSR